MPHRPQARTTGAPMGRQASAEALPHRTDSDRRKQPAGLFATGPRPPGTIHADAGHGRYASAQLNPHPAAAAQARRLTRQTLTRWDMADLTDDAETIASEIVANAINAATEPRGTLPAIILGIHHSPGQLRITVWDNGPGHPQPTDTDPDDERGRGLGIVNALTANNWGW